MGSSRDIAIKIFIYCLLSTIYIGRHLNYKIDENYNYYRVNITKINIRRTRKHARVAMTDLAKKVKKSAEEIKILVIFISLKSQIQYF